MSISQNIAVSAPLLVSHEPSRERERKEPREREGQPGRRDRDDPPTQPLPTREATLKGVAPSRAEIEAYRHQRKAYKPDCTQDVSLSEVEAVVPEKMIGARTVDLSLAELEVVPQETVTRDLAALDRELDALHASPAVRTAERGPHWLALDRPFALHMGAAVTLLVAAVVMVLGSSVAVPPDASTPELASAPPAMTTTALAATATPNEHSVAKVVPWNDASPSKASAKASPKRTLKPAARKDARVTAIASTRTKSKPSVRASTTKTGVRANAKTSLRTPRW